MLLPPIEIKLLLFYKCGWRSELRTTVNKSSLRSGRDLNKGPLDYKSGTLTMRPYWLQSRSASGVWMVVSLAAIVSVDRHAMLLQVCGEEHCVMTLKTAARETIWIWVHGYLLIVVTFLAYSPLPFLLLVSDFFKFRWFWLLSWYRRTYIGSMPGRILNALKTVGVKNPVILLDEVDKMVRWLCSLWQN